jgi:triacylglycerol lipase
MNRVGRRYGILVLGVLGVFAYPEQERARISGEVPSSDRTAVLLVPGWGDRASDMEPLRQRLIEAGWPEDEIRALTFSDPWGSNERNAVEVADAVGELSEQDGIAAVDIVAHSMGGLAVRTYLTEFSQAASDRPTPVRRVAFLATPHRGTVAAVLAWGEGGREMVPGSEFLEHLNHFGDQTVSEVVDILSIRSPVDLLVIPGSSAMLPGARNLEICCPTHHGMVNDDRVFDALLTFLLEGSDVLEHPDGTIPFRSDPGGWLDSLRNRGPTGG